MNYLEQIVAFNRWKEVNPLPASAIALWHELMAVCNRAGWIQEFTVPNGRLQSGAGLSRKEFHNARQRLIDKKLIKYTKSNNRNQAGKYIILDIPIVQKGTRTEHRRGLERNTDGTQTGTRTEHERGSLFKHKHKQNKDNIYVDFVNWYNSQFKTKHRVDTYREKLKTRLKTFSIDQLKTAAVNMHNDPYMTGKNENGRVYATLEYLLRNDKNVDKWLVQKPKTRSQPQEPVGDKFEGIYLT
jgi:hypothetical protein